MAKRLAIEWDSHELRVVAAVVRGDRVMITDVASQRVESNQPEQLGESLRKLLESRGLAKLAAGIALGRGKAELRELKLPPVPDAELPDMVRFQAIRNFSTAGERSAIDYIESRRDADGIRVVAAAVAPDELKNCALIALPSQLTVERLALRPLGAVSLFKRVSDYAEGEVVLIDLLADDADIVVLRHGHAAFVRSIRLPEDPNIRVRTLGSEVRRSLMACQEAGGEELPRRIYLWGRADVHADDVEKLSQALNSPVQTLDPFSLVDVDPKISNSLPEHVGRLAPLVGLLDAETRGGVDLIDFLNPRRPPEPPSKRNKYVIGGVLAASVVGAIFYLGWSKLARLDAEIAAKQERVESLEDSVKIATDSIAKTTQVDTFLAGDVFWLDEFRRTAESLPPSSDVMLSTITAKVGTNGGGSITLTGGATDSAIVSEVASKLRDEQHSVEGSGFQVKEDQKPYIYQFNTTVSFSPQYVAQTTEEPVAPPPFAKVTDAEASPSDVDDSEASTSESSASDASSEEPAATSEGEDEATESSDSTDSNEASESAESSEASDAGEPIDSTETTGTIEPSEPKDSAETPAVTEATDTPTNPPETTPATTETGADQ